MRFQWSSKGTYSPIFFFSFDENFSCHANSVTADITLQWRITQSSWRRTGRCSSSDYLLLIILKKIAAHAATAVFIVLTLIIKKFTVVGRTSLDIPCKITIIKWTARAVTTVLILLTMIMSSFTAGKYAHTGFIGRSNTVSSDCESQCCNDNLVEHFRFFN